MKTTNNNTENGKIPQDPSLDYLDLIIEYKSQMLEKFIGIIYTHDTIWGNCYLYLNLKMLRFIKHAIILITMISKYITLYPTELYGS